jgi:PAS domain S-box-containing protein
MATEEPFPLLGLTPATRRGRRAALNICGLLLLAFAFTVPFAGLRLPALRAFAPATDMAVLILDLITAVLLYTQYRELRTCSFLALTCAYMFTLPLTVAHALSFPNAFPGYAVGGEQTEAWLWMLWHGLFPLFVMAYAWFAWLERKQQAASASFRAAPAFAATLAVAALLILVAIGAEQSLPKLMQGDSYRIPETHRIVALGWGAHLVALGMLLSLTRVRRVVDLWISVTVLTALIEMALCAILANARFELGFYVGRIYGLLAASVVLILLLRETFRLEARMVRAWNGLQASEERFRTLANTAPALIWLNNAEGQNVFVNQHVVDFTGKSAQEIGGFGWQALVHPHDASTYIAGYMAAVQAHGTWRSRERMRRHDGEWRWLDNYATPIFDQDGVYGGHVAVSIDVTDTVNAEYALKDASRMKDEFIALVAHELRNPLAPISSALHLLMHAHAAGRRSADRLVGIVDRQIAQMVRLVDDLLEMSRITSGKIELKRETVNLLDVIHAAVESSMPVIEQGRHQVRLVLPEQPLWVNSDAMRLIQVFANLLNNAAKYTNDGGVITVTAASEGQQAVVSVRDNGMGIPTDRLEDVFELYHQLPGAAHRGAGGLGIGLSMVKRLVGMHGGTVVARSEGLNKGSEFIVRLPLSEPCKTRTSAEPAAPRSERSPLSGCCVLVVDDNRDAAATLAELLQSEGAQVRVVHDGRAALAELDHYQPQAVLLDIGLPDISGYEVAKRIRGDPRFQGMQLIAVSGWGQPEDRIRSSEAGFDAHLTKPVDMVLLESLLVPRENARAGRT